MRIQLRVGQKFKHPLGWVREIVGFGYAHDLGEMVYYDEHHKSDTFSFIACKSGSFRAWIKKSQATEVIL